LVSVAMVCVMGVELLKRRRIRVPHGFTVWLVFLAWVVAGFFVVQVVAPGSADSEGGGSRYLTWGFRLAWYLQATVVVLFVVNLREDHSLTRIFRTMGWMFVTIVIGGFIGVVAPHVDFPSLLELGLPRSVSQIPFVKSQIHPNLAELQNDLYGPASSRPSAPFPYANVWGLNYACFLPFFMIGWFSGASVRRRCIGAVVIALSVVPVVYSLNRGLWASLAVLVVFTIARSSGAKRARTLIGVLVVALVAGLAIAMSPLGSQIEHRFTTRNSNDGRAQLTALAFDGMTSTSPVVGFGTTRSVQSSFNSIAVGASADCPLCTPPALGTQGQLSLVGFCQGWGGLVLYYGFFILILLRYIRLKTPVAIAAIGVVIVHLMTSPVYSADNVAILAIFCAIGVLERVRWSESAKLDPGATGGVHTWGRTGHGTLLRRSLAYVLIPVLSLAFVGWVLGRHSRVVTATVSMNIPAEQAYPGIATAPRTLDTEAQLVTSHGVIEAVASQTGQTTAEVASRIAVTARPNSRILNLTYRAPKAYVAGASVKAAATSLLHMRNEQIAKRQNAALAAIDTRVKGIQRGLNTVSDSVRVLRGAASAGVRGTAQGMLGGTAYRLYAESSRMDTQRQRAESLPLSPGSLLGPVSYKVRSDSGRVGLASGLALGLLFGLLLAIARNKRGYCVGRASRNGYLEPKLLGVVNSANPPEIAAFAADAVFLTVGADASLSRLIESDAIRRGVRVEPSRVVLVAGPWIQAARVNRVSRGLSRAGAEVLGLIVVGQ